MSASDSPPINFTLGALYSFDVYPVPILGTGFSTVSIMSIMTEADARRYTGTAELHAQFFPYLPAGTPDDPAGYNWVRVKTQAGEYLTLGLAWIKPESVVLIDAQTGYVTIPLMSADDVTKLRNGLAQLGFTDFTIVLR